MQDPETDAQDPESTLELVAVLLSPEAALLILVFGCVVWHWLYFLFYESKEGERRKNERRQERREYRGPPWSDPEI